MLPQKKGRESKIEKGADQLDAKAAAADADWAEPNAADAIDYAVAVVYDAQLAVLDALDARLRRRTGEDRSHLDLARRTLRMTSVRFIV
jgi:hypothetical protein